MEKKLNSPQFDSFLEGPQNVPDGVNLSEFIKYRMEEVVMLTEAIQESPFRGQAFQRLPKHMRRRQMSHYIKRLPRRLQRPYLISLKDGLPTPTKRPSRKYRRRPASLLLDYNRRQKNYIWMETHIWHAKRFHMCKKWGYKLPEKPVNKSFKACYRALSEHCLLIDNSYYHCIELQGPENDLLSGLKQCTSPECGLSFGAKMYLSGTREGFVTLFHPNLYPYGAIGNVSFIWQPSTRETNERKIWIWVHPSVYNEVIECFKLLFHFHVVNTESNKSDQAIVKEEYQKYKKKLKKENKKCKKKVEAVKLIPKNTCHIKTLKYSNNSVTMTSLKDTLNRFSLTGPLSQAVISQAFSIASVASSSTEIELLEVKSKRSKNEDPDVEVEKIEKRSNWWEKYYECRSYRKNWEDQKQCYEKMSQCISPTELPSGMILGLIIEDPRLKIPVKREKAVHRTGDYQIPVIQLNGGLSQSPIWIQEVRDEVSKNKWTTQEINQMKAKKIVPGFDATDVIPKENQSKIPILLVQRPGNGEPRLGKLGLGSGWHIIAPAGFGMPIWLSLIFRGARTGGLRESRLLELECSSLGGEHPSPDTVAGETESKEILENLKRRYFKLPPNKRANFRKLGVASPFYPPWKVLVRDWIEAPKNDVRFSVLRAHKILKELEDFVNGCSKGSSKELPSVPSGENRLVPVLVECIRRGKPNDLALICLPTDEDFQNKFEPKEPVHVDGNEKLRKILKREHVKLLKSLKRKRKKEKAKLKEEFAGGPPGKLKWNDILKRSASEACSREYNGKMEKLWLADAENIESVADMGSRRVLGFVVKGDFSYSKSCGLGLGYVTLPGLLKLLEICKKNKSNAVVLIRNRNQVQYRFGKLKIAVR